MLDSTEMLMYGDEAWSVIESLKLPALIIAPFLISIKNLVFLTGRFFVAIALGSDPFRHWNKNCPSEMRLFEMLPFYQVKSKLKDLDLG